jgi:predicted thioesterase
VNTAGHWVDITEQLVEVSGNAVAFEFTARDGLEEIAHGMHSRFIVGLEKTVPHLQAKFPNAKEAGVA